MISIDNIQNKGSTISGKKSFWVSNEDQFLLLGG